MGWFKHGGKMNKTDLGLNCGVKSEGGRRGQREDV